MHPACRYISLLEGGFVKYLAVAYVTLFFAYEPKL
jgi:hypothetical protein